MTTRRWRTVLVVAGALLALFGVFRLLTQVPLIDGLVLAGWLVAAAVLHDGVLQPIVLGVGALVVRIPARARRHVQFALVVGGCIAVIGLVLAVRRGSQARVKALLLRDYGLNLAILLGLVVAVSLIAYAGRVVHDVRSRGTVDD